MKKTIILVIILCLVSILEVHAKTLDNGEYVISSKKDLNKVIDLSGGLVKNGSNIQLYSFNDSKAQIWNIKYNDGYYTITTSKNTKYSLDIAGGLLRENSNVQLYSSNNTKAQRFKLIEDDKGYYSITTIDEKYALDLPGGKFNNGTNIQLYKNNKTDAQKYTITKNVTGAKTIADGIYEISTNNKLLSIENASIKNNNKVNAVDNSNLETQKWIVKYLNNGCYSLTSYSNKLFSLSAENKLLNSNIIITKNNTTYSKQWIIKDNNDGTYAIISKYNGYSLEYANNKVTTNTNQSKFTFTKLNIEEKKLPKGEYVISSSVDPNKVVDLSGGLIKNGSNIQLYSYNGTTAQHWLIEYKTGYYTITSAKNNKYSFDVAGGLFKNNSNVQLYSLNNTKAQRWDIIENEDGYYSILTTDDKFSIDLPGGKTNNGTNIQLYQSNYSNAQKYSITKEVIGKKTIEDGVYKIKTNNNVFTISNNNLILSQDNNSSTQKWLIKYLNNGYYSINSISNINTSINIVNGKKVPGSNVNVYSNNNTDSQKFVIKSNDDGTYSIIAKNSGLNLDSVNNNIELNKEMNISTQKFTLEEADFGEEILPSGTYFITTAVNKSSSLNVSNIVNNSNVFIYTNNSTSTEKWQFKYIGNGYYAILNNSNTNYALTAINETPSNVVISEYKNLNTQKWVVKKNSDSTYTILNKRYNAIDLAGAKTTNNTNISIYTNNNSTAQKFILYKTADGNSNKLSEDGYYFIASSTDENYVLESKDTSKISNGTNIQMNKKKSTKNQKWYLTYISNGYYTIASGVSNSFVLDISGASQNSGANIQAWVSNKSYAQQWLLKDNGDGTYSIVSNCGNLYLDSNGNTGNATANTYSNNSNQKFRLQKTRLENLVIDVSAHNGNIDWNNVKANAGIYGVIVRIAAGSQYEDSKLAYNISELKKLGIPYGIYIYSYAENQNGTVNELGGTYHEAQLEALRVISAIKKYDLNPTLGIYYDLEVWENGGNKNWNSTDYSHLIDNFNSVMDTNGYPDWKIYANLSMANSSLKPWQNRITWIAQWNDTCTYQSYYNVWQYTSKGTIPGIDGYVDLNIYFID